MPLNPSSVGHTTAPLTFTYDWQDTVRYALGIGATVNDLDFLYEGRGPKVYPTYAVIPGFKAAEDLFHHIGGNLLGLVHAGQKIELMAPLPAKATLTTTATVAGLYDLKRMAQAVLTTETRTESGAVLCKTEWSLIFRFDGGFGGEPPPKREDPKAPKREADWVIEEPTTKEQALLYRLSGDLNPLHADPKFATDAGFPGPILHGLCTYGYVGRAVLKQVCGGDPTRLKSFSGQFRKPVYPGETIRTEGWHEDGKILLRTSVAEKPEEYVFANAYAEIL